MCERQSEPRRIELIDFVSSPVLRGGGLSKHWPRPAWEQHVHWNRHDLHAIPLIGWPLGPVSRSVAHLRSLASPSKPAASNTLI